MRISTPLDKARLRNHMTYHFWIYILVAVLSIFGWNLLYTMTAYRSPEDKRIDLYIQSGTVSEQSAASFIQPIWDEYVPEMEVVDAIILSSNAQEYYGSVQLTVYIMSQEGDMYLLSSSDFKSFASQGVFLDLQPFIDDGRLDLSGIDLSAGYVAITDENGYPTGERRLFGIPLYSLYGLMEGMSLDNRDVILSVTVYNGNEENVLRFLNGFIKASRGDKPDWLGQDN